MDTTVIRKQIDYLALARRQNNSADNLSFEEGAKRKAKVIRHQIQELRKQALKCRGPAVARLVLEADTLDQALKSVLMGPVDA
jgi:hypothetical protein